MRSAIGVNARAAKPGTAAQMMGTNPGSTLRSGGPPRHVAKAVGGVSAHLKVCVLRQDARKSTRPGLTRTPKGRSNWRRERQMPHPQASAFTSRSQRMAADCIPEATSPRPRSSHTGEPRMYAVAPSQYQFIRRCHTRRSECVSKSPF